MDDSNVLFFIADAAMTGKRTGWGCGDLPPIASPFAAGMGA
jgi:hypothetical protein